jgi:hypothetical protein
MALMSSATERSSKSSAPLDRHEVQAALGEVGDWRRAPARTPRPYRGQRRPAGRVGMVTPIPGHRELGRRELDLHIEIGATAAVATSRGGHRDL